MNKTLMHYLDLEAEKNGWENFNEVVFCSEERRTILTIIEDVSEKIKIKKKKTK